MQTTLLAVLELSTLMAVNWTLAIFVVICRFRK